MLAGGRLCCIQMSLGLLVGGLEGKCRQFPRKLQLRPRSWNELVENCCVVRPQYGRKLGHPVSYSVVVVGEG